MAARWPGAAVGAASGYAGRPVYTFETGGSTGVPKSRINIEDFRLDYEAFSDTLPDEFFRRAPTGCRLVRPGRVVCGCAVEHLTQYRGGICFP